MQVFLVAILLAEGGISATAQQKVAPPVFAATAEGWCTCLQTTVSALQSRRVTPERFAMAMEGACSEEARANENALRTHLESMPTNGVSLEFARQTTEQTMSKVANEKQEIVRSIVSQYTIWYETSRKDGVEK